MVISARNPVHSVLFLILAFFNSAGLFVLLGAEFLALILVVVYVGAVAVLFLFVVMMLDVDFVELRQGFLQLPADRRAGRHRARWIELLLVVLGGWVDRARHHGGAHVVLPITGASIGPFPTPRRSATCSTPATSSSSRSGGLVLLVAMIGAIVLTLQAQAERQAAGRCRARWRDPNTPEVGGRSPARLTKDMRGQSPDYEEINEGPDRRTMEIGLSHYLTVAAILFTHRRVRHLPQPQERHHHPDVGRTCCCLAVNINLVAFSALPRRSRRTGLCAAGAHRRSRRGGHRPGHPRRSSSAIAAPSRSKTST